MISPGDPKRNTTTHTEFIMRPQLKLDVSRRVGQKVRVLEAGVGLRCF